jgi:hypothetical protein
MSFSKELKNIEGTLTDLKRSIGELSERIEDKNKGVNSIISEISERLECKMKTVTSTISEIESKVTDLYSRSEMEDKMKTVNSTMSEIESKVNDLYIRSEMEDKMKTVNSTMSEIESKVNDLYSKSEMEDKMKTVTSTMSEIESKIDAHIIKTDSSISKNDYCESSEIIKILIDIALPKDFDYINYREMHEDLKEYDEFSLKKHYLLHGKAENRKYRVLIKKAPDDFNWKEYLRINIELLKHFSDDYTATRHYINYGIYENRMYKESQLEDVNFFIYCGRKSGSTTLNHTCSNIENSLSIQIHNNEDYLYKYGQCRFNSIFDLVENNMTKHETIYIIDSYRTPIEKKISSFFEDIDKYIPNYKDCDISFLISYFNKKYIYGNNCTHIYTEDYEPLDEMLEHFKLSPINKFNFDQKFELIKYKNIVFIKLRFHEIENWDVLLSKILGKDITIIDKNKSENKNYYEVYEAFKKNYRIPRDYLEKLKSDSRFKIYNSSLERIKYIKNWSLKSTTDV